MANKRFNPLVLDPENYDQLFDSPFTDDGDEEKPQGTEVYEPLSYGARRKKPIRTDY